MKIAYIGSSNKVASARHRYDALCRIGLDVDLIDPSPCAGKKWYTSIAHYRTGFVFAQWAVSRFIKARLAGKKYDLIWVDNGELIGRKLLMEMRRHSPKIINYNLDDPTGVRDGIRWFTLRRAIGLYDLCVVVREESEREYPKWGARRIMRVWRSADEVEHKPRDISAEDRKKWSSEVAFVGTWMPERGPWLTQLVRRGVKLSFWGGRWHKDPHWAELKPYWRGPPIFGDEYAKAIQCARLNLGLLSKGNRDLHTQRTAEIPMLGGLFFAERTKEHLELYRDGVEAVFWNDVDECAARVAQLAGNHDACAAIAARGQARMWANGLNNEAIVAKILNVAMGRPS